MSKKIIILLAVVVVLAIGAFALTSQKSYAPSKKSTAKSPASSSLSAKTEAQPSAASTGTSFVVNANDDSADPMTLNVKKGDKVTVTFNVSTNGVYYGGLEFKSSVVSTKPIKPGNSDTVSFTADKSFDFVPYWYQSNVKKPYVVAVKVQ